MLAALCLTFLQSQNAVQLRNLSETPFAKYGADMYKDKHEKLVLRTDRQPAPTVVLTKYDNLDASVYREVYDIFSSIRVIAVGRPGAWWGPDGNLLEATTVDKYGPPPKLAKDEISILVSKKNFSPRNGIIDTSQSWAWRIFGNTASADVLAHFGPDHCWVKVPNPGKGSVAIPIWLERTKRVGERLKPELGQRASVPGIDLEVVSVDGRKITLWQQGESAVRMAPEFKDFDDYSGSRFAHVERGEGVTEHVLEMACLPSRFLGFVFWIKANYFGYVDGIPATPNSN